VSRKTILVSHKVIRVRDLPSPSAGVSQLCIVCRETFSADRSDYWMLSADTVLKHCGKPIRLVREVVRYKSVLP
jgi:hypothetical protein